MEISLTEWLSRHTHIRLVRPLGDSMRLSMLALPVLVLVGCYGGGETVPWPGDDGAVIARSAPDNKDLPAPRKDSYRILEVSVLLEARRLDLFDSPDYGAQIGSLPLVGPEPVDLDLLVTVNSRMELPAAYRLRLERTYLPVATSDELPIEWTLAWSDFTSAKPKRLLQFRRDGPPADRSISGTFHQEVSLVDRARYRSGGHIMVVRFRNRLESEHRDWMSKETKVLIEWENGVEFALPVFKATSK